MKVGILGSGDVAKSLADGFLKHGYEVMLGTRNAAKLAEWGRAGPGRGRQRSRGGKVWRTVVLAVKGGAAAEALRVATRRSGRQARDRRDQSDCRRAACQRRPEVLHRPRRVADGAAAARVCGARFVKAFNSVGSACMVNPQFKGGKPTMFICGNDEAAKKTWAVLLSSAGKRQTWAKRRPRAQSSRFACSGAFRLLRNDWVHAFKLLR